MTNVVAEWVWQTAVKKGVGRGIQLIVAWLVAIGIENVGIKLDVNELTLAAFAGLEILRNWLKIQFKISWL